MKKITLACLYRTTDKRFNANTIAPNWQPLRINGNDVRFLIDILCNQSTFHDITQNVWRLDFFEQSPFRQVLYVSVIEVTISKTELATHEQRQQWAKQLRKQAFKQIKNHLPEPRDVVQATFVETEQYEPNKVEVLTASQLIRGTNSMEFDTLDRHSDRFIHVDGRGTCLFSTSEWHKYTFKRQVILLGLAKAYLLAMNEIMNGLATHCEDTTTLPPLYKNALIFNAKYFFANPVKVNRYDAFQLWQGIRRCTMVDDINREITQQLKAVHQILSEEEETKQMKSELRLNKRVGWLGVAIGMLSLISLFEITPQKVGDFVKAWLLWFTH